jgi:hypothetical protein
MAKGVYATIPHWRQLLHWQVVCCYLDSQPYRAVKQPFPGEPPMSVRLFKRMAAYGLVRHRDDCTWRLSPSWRRILLQLAAGLPPESASERTLADTSVPIPFVVDAGVDTLYVHLYTEAGLPDALVAACDAYKAQAQEENETVETPWRFFSAPFSMYKAGQGTSQKGRGVSWSFLLRNAWGQLLLRRRPLNALVGSVRLSAECLWTYGPRGALDGMRADLEALWMTMASAPLEVRFQLSQIHLCADVAHFRPTPADLGRLLTRSLKKAVYIPSLAEEMAAEIMGAPPDELEALVWADLVDASWLLGDVPPEWQGVPLGFYDEVVLEREDWNQMADESGEQQDGDTNDGRDEDLEMVEEGAGAAVYLWGQRASGFAFSQGADLSAVWYDKTLQERQSGRRWMQPIHQAGGWLIGMPLTRIEARFRRGILRDLVAAGTPQGARGPQAPDQAVGAEGWFDDPWVAMEHLGDLWACFAGLPPEADTAPDVTYRGWMRLVVPEERDTNRTRWRTDPVWELIQRAQFSSDQHTALKRLPHRVQDLNQVDAELYGLLKLRAVLRGEYLDTTATLSLEVRAFVERMDEVDAELQRDFAEEVREKARMLGRCVPRRLSLPLSRGKERA